MCWQAGRLDFNRVAREMRAGDVSIWRAWYDLEPRGDKRQDVLTAFLSSVLTLDKDIGIADILRAIRDLWTPLTKAEKQRRKRMRKRKTRQRHAATAMAVKALKHGKQHRHDSGQGNS